MRPRGLGFLYQRFSSLLRNEACQFRNQQSRMMVKFGDHGSIRDSWPIAFSGYPRGPRVRCETRCPKHAAPNKPAETRSRTKVSREPDSHRQRKFPGMVRTRSEILKLFVVSDIWRRSLLLSSIRSIRSWQSSSLRSGGPSRVSSLWPPRLQNSWNGLALPNALPANVLMLRAELAQGPSA
jgi:hypothetical protein